MRRWDGLFHQAMPLSASLLNVQTKRADSTPSEYPDYPFDSGLALFVPICDALVVEAATIIQAPLSSAVACLHGATWRKLTLTRRVEARMSGTHESIAVSLPRHVRLFPQRHRG